MRRSVVVVAVATMVSAGGVALAGPASAQDIAEAKARQLAAGVQIVPKGSHASGIDPLLAYLPDLSNVDIAGARRARVAEQAALRGRSPQAKRYTEREPVGVRGRNDTDATADFLFGFGSAAYEKFLLSGNLVPDSETKTLPPFAEDNGSIALAPAVGMGRRIRTSGVIGDGPHGSGGDKKGDYDFYKVSGLSSVTIDVDTPNSDLDSVVAVYNAAGTQIATNDDQGPDSSDSLVTVPLSTPGDYYILVSGFGENGTTFPQNPSDSGSGLGTGSEGAYTVTLSGPETYDKDVYSFVLRAGDVIGAAVTGGATRLEVHDFTGREVFGSSQDFTMLHPANSPLPRGGNAVVDFVAPTAGKYTLHVRNGEGSYEAAIEAYRPGPETKPRGTVQTLFLDFDGAQIDVGIFNAGATGVRTLSPFSTFLKGWGLTPADENVLIDRIIDVVRENIEKDLAQKSTNRNFGVRILNSRDHADPFGQPNVSRLIIGGSIAESGIPTVGIAQSIDPGNLGTEESALLLLDVLSGPTGRTSLNTYLTSASDKIKFVAQGVGNIAAHEVGHFIGSWHVDQFNEVAGLMDQGGNPHADVRRRPGQDRRHR
ncbi:PPC domain-containing protein [Kibdelosporangium philippinense]|uniref:PPC domain-containing protein n=1 Tax=Kibdelosporangium philippinense TaxID=211113 RepID=A0ABS8Z5L2_9PSEU|nr:PPC domain-containing protein [Kibdelosporangium philippinense]MCE7002792.1 PPC domain-containing protein [Kibdelosporangium philippinense]